MQNPKVSIILLNYNWLKFNKDCVDSLLTQSYTDFEIIFVDNVSTDWSVEVVEQLYKNQIENWKIIIIRNLINNWFSWWNNTGVLHSNATDYVWLLNNDTIVHKDALKYLIKWIESDEKLWAVWSLIFDNWYEEQIKNELFNNHNLVTSSVLGESVFKKIDKLENILYTEALSWCSILYRKEILELPFLDFYFAYAEDFYISWLLIKKWYKLWFCTKSIVNHYWSWSFWKDPSEFKLFYWNRNQIINLYLFYSNLTLIKLLPLILLTQFAHIFVNVPLRRIKAKFKWLIRIIKNRKILKWIKSKIKSESKINDNEFIELLEYKLIDNISVYNLSLLKIKIINFINIFFKIYINIFL